MHQDNETGFFSQIQNPIEGRIEEAGHAAGNLAGDELLMNGELTDTAKHTGIESQDAPDVTGRVHIRRIEPCDHRIEARLFLFGE